MDYSFRGFTKHILLNISFILLHFFYFPSVFMHNRRGACFRYKSRVVKLCVFFFASVLESFLKRKKNKSVCSKSFI
jgi:hypothetical protein